VVGDRVFVFLSFLCMHVLDASFGVECADSRLKSRPPPPSNQKFLIIQFVASVRCLFTLGPITGVAFSS